MIKNKDKKKCTKCGEEFPLTNEYFYYGDKAKNWFRPKCKHCAQIADKKYYQNNREKVQATNKKYYQNNKEKVQVANKKYQQANPEKVREMNRKQKAKEHATLKGNLSCRMRNMVRHSLKGRKKGQKWEGLLGYTVDKLKKHLEELFTEGMTWEQLLGGKIHIDHIIPIKAFNFTKPEHTDFKRCWALKNLQPLWAKDNQSKHAKLKNHFQPTLF